MENADLVGTLQRDPSRLTDHELIFLDYCAHREWSHKGDGKKVYFPNCSPAHLLELHMLVREQMSRRGIRHLIDDDLDARSAVIERQRRTAEAGFLPPATGGSFLDMGGTGVGERDA